MHGLQLDYQKSTRFHAQPNPFIVAIMLSCFSVHLHEPVQFDDSSVLAHRLPALPPSEWV